MIVLEEIVQLDKDLFLFLNGLGTTTWDGFWLFMTNKWGSIPLYVFLLLMSFKVLGWKKTLLVLLGVALLITTTDQLANFFKYGVQRLRPCHDDTVFEAMRLVKRSCGGKFGYFSAHAANSMAVASFFSFLFRAHLKWLPLLLALWAVIVAYSRIYIGVHYPADIITGILIGLFFGWIYFKLFSLVTKKK